MPSLMTNIAAAKMILGGFKKRRNKKRKTRGKRRKF